MMIHALCVVLLLILLRWQQQDIIMGKTQKKYVILCTFFTLVVVLAEVGCLVTDNTSPENIVWSFLFNMVGFGMSPFVFLVESKAYCRNKTKRGCWIYVPAVFNVLVVLSSPFTGGVFYVNDQCEYSRGDCFLVYVAAIVFSIVFSMYQKVKIIQNYPVYFRFRIISSTCVMIVGLFIQIVFPQYRVSWMIISVYLLLYYALSCEAVSMVDGLTGLLNRTAFNAIANNLEQRTKGRYYLIMLDLNDFKMINDTKGHAYGDECLREVAAILVSVFGKSANVFRYGGDEFSVLLKADSNSGIDEYLKKLNRRMAAKMQSGQLFPEAALGYGIIDTQTEVREAVQRADCRMYQNKRQRKGEIKERHVNSRR